VLYASRTRAGAFAETLSRFRPDLEITAELSLIASDEEDDRYTGSIPPGAEPRVERVRDPGRRAFLIRNARRDGRRSGSMVRRLAYESNRTPVGATPDTSVLHSFDDADDPPATDDHRDGRRRGRT
jgi:hypothetical protein